MCMGAAPPRATITMPDTGAFDRLANQQIALLNGSTQAQMLRDQERYTQALQSQQQTLAQLNVAAQQRANQTAADAQRIAAMIGTPAPSPAASAPAIASDRTGKAPARGKAQLRIDRASTAASAGTGLNIGA